MGKLLAKAMGSGGVGAAAERARAVGSCCHSAAARPSPGWACCRAASHPSCCRLSRAAAWGIGSETSGGFSWSYDRPLHEAVQQSLCYVAWAAATWCRCVARRRTNQNLMKTCLIRSWIPTRSRGGLSSPCCAAQPGLQCQLSQAAAALALLAPTALATLIPPCSGACQQHQTPRNLVIIPNKAPKWLHLSHSEHGPLTNGPSISYSVYLHSPHRIPSIFPPLTFRIRR